MQIVVKRTDQTETNLNIGHTLMVAAAGQLRESKKGTFEYVIAQIGNLNIEGDKVQPAIMTALQEFLIAQLPSDAEVAMWLRTWDGRFFSIQHATKKTLKLEGESAQDFLDELSSEDYNKIVQAIDALIDGEEETKVRFAQIATEIQKSQVRLEIQKSELESLQYELEAQKKETASKREKILPTPATPSE